MRASIAAEAAGHPTVSLVCEGFEGQARATGRGFGFDGLALGIVPGHVDAQSADEMEKNFLSQTLEQVINGLTGSGPAQSDPASEGEPAALDIAASGTIDQINAAFTAFEQTDSSRQNVQGGTGLGLPLSRHFCALMGGTISVESEVGKGSTFTVRLPAEIGGEIADTRPGAATV